VAATQLLDNNASRAAFDRELAICRPPATRLRRSAVTTRVGTLQRKGI
jgi:hypothetical protein